MFHGLASGFFGGLLGSKRSRFTGTFETDVACRGPRHNVALLVAETDDGVVEGTLNVRDAVSDVFAFFATGASCYWRWFSIGHDLLSIRFLAGDHFRTFFLPATVLRGPLRVRAFVWVR